MIDIHRAISFCPTCSSEQEVWFRYGQVVPNDLVSCFNCETAYESSKFIVKLLELRTNTTVSARIGATKV